MIGLDTNVLMRYVIRDDAAQSEQADAVMESLTADRPGFITHVVIAELAWTLARTYRMDKTTRLKVLRALVETESLEFEDGESVVRALSLAEEGADFADALISASGEMFGVTDFVTFDRDAARRLDWRLLEPAPA